MLEALLDAVIDCAKMLPILYLAYLLMEFFEHKAGEKTNNLITKVGRAGPIVGSLLGIIPQCGFSGAVAGSVRGTALIVRTFFVTSSPTEPLPLVAARTSFRFS